MMDSPIVDFDVLDRLRRETSTDLITSLLNEFCDNLRSRLARIEQIALKGNHAAAARDAHILNSESATFGAMGLNHAIRQLESHCQGYPDGETVKRMCDAMHKQADLYLNEIRASEVA